MTLRRAQDEVLERLHATAVEEEEALEVDGADALGELVGELGERVCEEVRGDGRGEGHEVVVRGERVRLDRAERRLGEDERIERAPWRAERREGHAVAHERVERGGDGIEGWHEMRDGEAVDCVGDDVEYVRALGDGHRRRGPVVGRRRGREEPPEGVA